MATRVPNADYREDWQALHDAAADRRSAAWAASQALVSEGATSSLRYEVLTTAHDDANLLCCQCLENFQHETLDDCLAWLERYSGHGHAFGLSAADFTTAPQLIHEFCRWSNLEKDNRRIASQCLPLAPSRPLMPFSNPAKAVSVRADVPASGYLVEFNEELIHSRRGRIDVLFTLYKTLMGLHVVVRNTVPGQAGVRNYAEDCIGYFYSNAEVLLKQAFGPSGPAFSPFRLNFYIYVAPAPSCREIYDRIAFQFDGQIRFKTLESIPACLRSDGLSGGTLSVPQS